MRRISGAAANTADTSPIRKRNHRLAASIAGAAVIASMLGVIAAGAADAAVPKPKRDINNSRGVARNLGVGTHGMTVWIPGYAGSFRISVLSGNVTDRNDTMFCADNMAYVNGPNNGRWQRFDWLVQNHQDTRIIWYTNDHCIGTGTTYTDRVPKDNQLDEEWFQPTASIGRRR